MGYEIFVDASCKPKQYRMGWGIVIVYNEKIVNIIAKRRKTNKNEYNINHYGIESNSTRAELIAVIDAIEHYNNNYNDDKLDIYNDNENIINTIEKGLFYVWRLHEEIDVRANGDLWKYIANIWDHKKMKISRYPSEKKIYYDLAHFLSRNDFVNLRSFYNFEWLKNTADSNQLMENKLNYGLVI